MTNFFRGQQLLNQWRPLDSKEIGARQWTITSDTHQIGDAPVEQVFGCLHISFFNSIYSQSQKCNFLPLTTWLKFYKMYCCWRYSLESLRFCKPKTDNVLSRTLPLTINMYNLTVTRPLRSLKSMHLALPMMVPPCWMMSDTLFQSASTMLSPPSTMPYTIVALIQVFVQKLH